MRDGAARMKRVTLELGGKSPSILLDDAVLDQAIPSALTMAFLNSGEACAAGTRLLVPKNPLDAVKQAIRRAMRAFTVGDPAAPKPPWDRWYPRDSMTVCNPTSARASKKARKCSSAARAVQRVSKRVTM